MKNKVLESRVTKQKKLRNNLLNHNVTGNQFYCFILIFITAISIWTFYNLQIWNIVRNHSAYTGCPEYLYLNIYTLETCRGSIN